jgi:hypothetical protein
MSSFDVGRGFPDMTSDFTTRRATTLHEGDGESYHSNQKKEAKGILTEST